MGNKKKNKNVVKKLHKHLSNSILAIIRAQPDREFNYRAISTVLGIKDKFTQDVVKELLLDLEQKNEVVRVDVGKFKLTVAEGVVEGRVDMASSGNAYLVSNEEKEDIYLTVKNLNGAFHGDTVSVRIIARKKNGRAEGEVLEVLKRARESFVGVLEVSENFAFLIPDDKKMLLDIFIPLNQLKGGKDGQKAQAKIVEWPKGSKNPVGIIEKVFGDRGNNETEMNAILAEYGFPEKFPNEIEAEASRISFNISKQELARRKDFRKVTTFTIDPEDAKDFDDALSLRKLKNGNWEVGVHIADVTHYIHENSMLEKEAAQRATSVYLVDRVIPMLPEVLSNGVCSLRPNEDKLTFSAVFELTDNAEIVNEWFGKTIIHSNKRFTYEDVQKMIEGAEGELKDEILILHKLAQILRKERFQNGALKVEQTEIKFKIDQKGRPYDVYFKESKEANWLIEEFMLLANKKVSTLVSKMKNKDGSYKPFVYRVHDQPDKEKLKELARFVSNFGYKINLETPKTISQSINKMLTDLKGKAEESMITQLTIRSMAKAVYQTDNIGHYGLSFDYYTHFTSPIRRYPDMMVHRLLFRYLENKEDQGPDRGKLEQYCKHSSEMEKRAAEAERASIRYKMAEYLSERIGEQFEGVITGVTEWGIYVEIKANKCEGMVRLKDMTDDFYYFDEKKYCIIGRRKGKTFRLGDDVEILVNKVDLATRQIDFLMVDMESDESVQKPIRVTRKKS